MTSTSMAALVRHLRKITNPIVAASVSDAELLERFVTSRDEAAFELLVWRHQRLVLGVCRRVLGNIHDTEDAFQATFLALARKAATVGRGDAVASWLHTVAFRIALRIRAAAQRMKTNVDLTAVESRADPSEEAQRRDLAELLDEEISRLPRKYRIPVVLCYLEGKSYAEASRQLGVAEGTLAGRLMRARELLRKRLLRRGIGVSGAFLGVVLGEQASLAAAPAALVNTTVKAAAAHLLGESAATGAISSTVAALTEGALRSMVISKVKIVMVALLAGLFVTGMGLLIPAALVSPAIVKETPPPDAPPSEGKAKSVRVDDYGDPLPEGALRRLGTLRFRHGGGIHNLLLTPDGKTLVSNDYYGTRKVCVWDLATGKLLRQLPGTYMQKNIALSPDGKLVAICQREFIVLWDLNSGKEKQRLAQPAAHGTAFSPDGKLLAAGGEVSGIHLWDLTTGKQIALFRDPRVADLLAFTPDGRTLIAGQQFDSKIGLWDMASGKKRQELDAKSGNIFSLSLSPDGAMLATGSRKDGIPLWDVKTGKLLRRLGKEGGRECYNVAFAPNGKTLVAIERDTKRNQDSLGLWDVAGGKELSRFTDDSGFWSIVFSRDGKTLIVASSGTIRLLDAATSKEVGPTAGSPGYAGFAVMSPDGRTLAYYRHKYIHFWDMRAGQEIGVINAGPSGTLSLAFAPDGKTMVASAGAHDINFWDVNTRKLIRRLQWDKKERPYAWWAGGFAFSTDGRLLASSDTKSPKIRLLDVTSGKQVRQLDLSDPKAHKNNWVDPNAVAFSPDGRLLAASGRTGFGGSRVAIWETATGKELPHLTRIMNDPAQKDEPNHSPGVSMFESKSISPKVVFSPNGRMMVKNGRPKTIAIWETATGRQRLLLKGHEESTVCVAFAPDGRTLASASWDESIRLWDLDTGRELRKLTGHRGHANSLAFSADGKTLVSTGDDTTILFWDVAAITGRKRPQAGRLAAREWQALWEDLIQNDAAKAYAAMVRMAADGETTLAAFKARLSPVRPIAPEQLARLLKELDSDEFAVRESASRELEKVVEPIEPTVRQTLGRPGLSLELRRRLEALSASLDEISGERLRHLRAIEVLEMLGTAEAREMLKALAGGAPEALTTAAARGALKRAEPRP
ncbi:MAG: sigma-70 family RNA polymerase sigma factor [Gemmataceae bacterium]